MKLTSQHYIQNLKYQNRDMGFAMKLVVLLVVCISPFVVLPIMGQGFQENVILQPEFDKINMTAYLLNDRLLKFQLKCVLFDGPCDAVGHWLKPRAKSALLGECLKCTETQRNYLQTWMGILVDYFPEIHRAAVAKYISGQGIAVSQEDRKLIMKINSFEGWAEFRARLNRVMIDMQQGKISQH